MAFHSAANVFFTLYIKSFQFAGKVNVSESEGFSRRYTSTLEIANITSADGGFITCSYVGVSFENSDELAAGEDDILVHVRGTYDTTQ